MGRVDDLHTLVRLLKEFDLPVSPILEYAIKEKMDSFGSELEIHESIKAAAPFPELSHNSEQGLRVEFPDGTVICEMYASETLKRAINKIGPHMVEILCFSEEVLRPCDVDLVSKEKTIDKRYVSSLHPIYQGYYLFTKTSTNAKKRQLEVISRALSLNLKVDVV